MTYVVGVAADGGKRANGALVYYRSVSTFSLVSRCSAGLTNKAAGGVTEKTIIDAAVRSSTIAANV